MAFIGLRHPVFARITEFEDGAMPCYAGPVVAGRAIQANVTKTHNNNPLYADDIIDEDDNSITGMTLTIGLNDLDDEKRRWLLGDIMSYEQGVGYLFDEGGDGAAPVGFGYIRVRKVQGQVKYQAVWYWSVLFSEESEDGRTKGESIEWQTPTITGRAKAIYADDSGIPKFRRRKTFDTQAEAEAWLDAVAGYNIPADLALQSFGIRAMTPTFTPRRGEYESRLEIKQASVLSQINISATPYSGQNVEITYELVETDVPGSIVVSLHQNEPGYPDPYIKVYPDNWAVGDTAEVDLYATVSNGSATAQYHVKIHIVIVE